MLANEKHFDDQLKRIGDLYEEGKDCMHELPIGEWHGNEMRHYSRVFEILRELRDIAAVSLKSNHEVKEN